MNEQTEPSELTKDLINAVGNRKSLRRGMDAMTERASEFSNPLESILTGIALDPRSLEFADQFLDEYWSNSQYTTPGDQGREVIIGSGYHAAVYSAVRVLSGFPKPLVLERSERVGGSFAMTSTPTFYLNSKNRAGMGGIAGDNGASLNYLPGAPIQPANISMLEYQTNKEMAFAIRLALAQYADVVTNANVTSIDKALGSTGLYVRVGGGGQLIAGRLIDARGLGDPRSKAVANGKSILTFEQFMSRMSGMWPLRNLKRVAVIGGGDAAKCAIESFLGISPQPFMAAMALDHIDRVDCYSRGLPTTCEAWKEAIRGRYQSIGRYLRSDRFGVGRINIIERIVEKPIQLPNSVLIDGRNYDLAVMCTGNVETSIPGLEFEDSNVYSRESNGENIARKQFDAPVFRIGPHARLLFSDRERRDGIADLDDNRVSMFRTGPKTATLASTLPKL